MSNSRNNLQAIAADARMLEDQWSEVSRAWSDQVAADFRRLRLVPVGEAMEDYRRALADLLDHLEHAERND